MTAGLSISKKRKNHLLRLVILYLMFCNVFGSSASAQMVIDHTCTDISKIPDYWIHKVKEERLLVQYVGSSHGRQLPNGLILLETENAQYDVAINEDLNALTEPNVLRIVRSQYSYGSWSGTGWGDDKYWSTAEGRQITVNSALQAISQNDPLDISLWCWCWDICRPASFFSQSDDFTDTHIQWYLDAIAAFNGQPDINQTLFIYHTSVTDCSDYQNPDGPWRVTYYNDIIRQQGLTAGGILFDQADMENWNIDNTQPQIETDDLGRTIYPRHSDYNESNGPDTYTDDHANDALCLRKAKALWWLMARLAGWNGCAAVAGDLTGDCRVDLADLEVISSYWMDDTCQGPFGCEGADVNTDGIVDLADFVQVIQNWMEGISE